MARTTGAKAADREFDDLRADIASWMEVSTVVAADQFASSEVTSRDSRQKIAEDLNKWQRQLITELVVNIATNKLGRTAKPPFRGLNSAPLMDLDASYPLTPYYLAKKIAGVPEDPKKKRPAVPTRESQSFFLYTGDLMDSLGGQLRMSLPSFSSSQVRPHRAKAEATQYKVKDKDGNIIGYRTQTNFRGNRGTFAKATVQSAWQVRVLTPSYYFETKPERWIPGLPDKTVAKLGNRGGKASAKPRMYRPLLGPYLSWFASQAVPHIVRENFNNR